MLSMAHLGFRLLTIRLLSAHDETMSLATSELIAHDKARSRAIDALMAHEAAKSMKTGTLSMPIDHSIARSDATIEAMDH